MWPQFNLLHSDTILKTFLTFKSISSNDESDTAMDCRIANAPSVVIGLTPTFPTKRTHKSMFCFQFQTKLMYIKVCLLTPTLSTKNKNTCIQINDRFSVLDQTDLYFFKKFINLVKHWDIWDLERNFHLRTLRTLRTLLCTTPLRSCLNASKDTRLALKSRCVSVRLRRRDLPISWQPSIPNPFHERSSDVKQVFSYQIFKQQ